MAYVNKPFILLISAWDGLLPAWEEKGERRRQREREEEDGEDGEGGESEEERRGGWGEWGGEEGRVNRRGASWSRAPGRGPAGWLPSLTWSAEDKDLPSHMTMIHLKGRPLVFRWQKYFYTSF